MNVVPTLVTEIGLGMLALLYAVKTGYLVVYLRRQYRELGSWHLVRTYENKATFGMLTTASAMVVVLGLAWWRLHLRNQGDVRIESVSLVPVFGFAVIAASWGLICSLRAMAYYEWPRWLWIALGAGALAVSVALAL